MLLVYLSVNLREVEFIHEYKVGPEQLVDNIFTYITRSE